MGNIIYRENNPKRGNYFWVKEPDYYPSLFKDVPLDNFKEGLISGHLAFTLETFQPIHIGSGKLIPMGNVLSQEFYNHMGLPIIPGSSLKGVIRHHFTTLVGERNARALFGTTEHSSRVLFSDALPVNKKITVQVKKIPERYGPRLRPPFKPAVKYYPVSARESDWDRRKERVNIVPKGAKFYFSLSFRNLGESEFGALLVAMGLDPKRRHGLKIGGGKSYGLGLIWIEPKLNESWLIEHPNDLLKPAYKRPKVTDDKIQQWVDTFWRKLPQSLRNYLQELEEEFSHEYSR